MHRPRSYLVIPACLAFASLACGDTGDSSTPTGASTASSSASSGSASSSSSSSSSSSGGAGAVDGLPVGDPAAVNAWLQKKEYRAWPGESGPREFTPGGGGHSGLVRAYLAPKLDASLKAGNTDHPVGAAAVKEFYDGETLTGWALSVKTGPSDGGKGWYWYEVFSVTPGASGIGGQGSGTCIGCHSSGQDFVRVPYPLK